MTTQLTLLPADSARWQLDDHTRAVGREGLAAARRALAELRTFDDQAVAESTIDLVARAA